LRAVSEAVESACLRFDYGAWDEGRGETEDVRAALAWARERYGTVSLFGYSFGGCLAVVAAAEESTAGSPPAAVSVLSPAASIGEDIDAVAAVPEIDAPLGIVYGERDRTVDAAAVAEAIAAVGGDVVTLPADHHFVGQREKVATAVAAQLEAP
jgi:alpha/beta superfamily hydrolase